MQKKRGVKTQANKQANKPRVQSRVANQFSKIARPQRFTGVF